MAILDFQKPDKVIMIQSDEHHGQFEFRPLEPGYGITIGNSLRRILLSSLEGFAISSIRIDGADHEFTTIKGVVEDVTEIILNLKQVRFKKKIDSEFSSERIEVLVKGKEQFTAGMIGEVTNNFEITNPDLVICNMNPSTNFKIELSIIKGRGYIPADDNKSRELSAGWIATDSIFTPIKNVKYTIENTRVEQRTDYEKLILEVSTDGTIHPEDAVKQAARIMIQHLMLITDENITFDTGVSEKHDVVDEQTLKLRQILKTPLEDLDLSVRAFNCLKAAKINSLSELVQYEQDELMKFRNFGQKSLSEIEQVLIDRGLGFGMDLSKINLDDL
jgi:DNA-directed RNA polymerase subunit alpha